MGVLNLEALVPIRPCLLQVQENGRIHKCVCIEVALPYLRTQGAFRVSDSLQS